MLKTLFKNSLQQKWTSRNISKKIWIFLLSQSRINGTTTRYIDRKWSSKASTKGVIFFQPLFLNKNDSLFFIPKLMFQALRILNSSLSILWNWFQLSEILHQIQLKTSLINTLSSLNHYLTIFEIYTRKSQKI